MAMDDLEQFLEKKLKENPEVAKRIAQIDPRDPKYMPPSLRKSKGLSVEDRLSYLEKDVENVTTVLAEVMVWIERQKEREMQQRLVEASTDPEKALELVKEVYAKAQEAKQEAKFAGDLVPGRAPKGAMIETPQGMISIEEIPGYDPDNPNWMPSHEWIEENCMCPSHAAQREAKKTGSSSQERTGFYL